MILGKCLQIHELIKKLIFSNFFSQFTERQLNGGMTKKNRYAKLQPNRDGVPCSAVAVKCRVGP